MPNKIYILSDLELWEFAANLLQKVRVTPTYSIIIPYMHEFELEQIKKGRFNPDYDREWVAGRSIIKRWLESQKRK